MKKGLELNWLSNKQSSGRCLSLEGKDIVWDHIQLQPDFSDTHVHKKLTRDNIYLTPTYKMRNNLATEVLDADMLYTTRAYQRTLKEPSDLDASITLLTHRQLWWID